ncbi:hypothetical protein F9946_12085 [Burkholderia thailandensis]|uniref:YeeE/YedE thiosulfate transporter family protein n=2 Tax=Burkholderia TaxID=32008 RepID=UPI0023612035|nr:YeeE/YedE thiosulfate transporter family protein [Burkholderia thailandensis]MDD1486897.1 hypothetical protein [Burkholderia thailandensis]
MTSAIAMFDLLSPPLVGLIGFAASRASLCTVRAVAEVLTSQRAWLLTSFAKAAAWTTVVSGVIALVSPTSATQVLERLPHGLGLVGGFLFGVGAAINGGCSLSTLQRLADGDLSMLGTLTAYILGALAFNALSRELGFTTLQALPTRWQGGHPWGSALLCLLLLWASWEVIRLWRPAAAAIRFHQRLVSSSYRLSSTAALLGIAGGLLYQLQGSWTYTNYLRAVTVSWLGAGAAPSAFHGLLLVALLGGMLLSSLQRGSFALNRQWHLHLPRRLAGGFLMGIGGTLVPGGNDTLILSAIPTLSLWALFNYLSLLSGIAAVMLFTRAMSGHLPQVECVQDECH